MLARRAFLAAGLAGLAGPALAACTGAGARGPSAQPGGAIVPPAAPSADAEALQRARAAAAALALAADRLAAVDHARARLLGDVAADHRANLAALAAAAPGSPTPGSPTPGPSGSGGAPRLAGAVRAEWDAASAALDDALHASPAIAALLARIAAQGAAHADLLAAAAGVKAPGPLVAGAAPAGPSAAAAPPPQAVRGTLPQPPAVAPPSVSTVGPAPTPGTPALPPGARDALVVLTAGEHAAVFAYGVVAARVSQGRRQAARAAWAWHVARRDLLEERLLAAGVQPPMAAPAYDVGEAPSAAGAARLAATVERRLAALAVRAVAATDGDDRREAIAGLVDGARRLAAWTGRPESLPG